MGKNNSKLRFARTINDLSDNMPKSRGDCFDYGQFGGCDHRCPCFQEGKCVNEDAYKSNMESEDIGEDEYNSLKELYKDKEFES